MAVFLPDPKLSEFSPRYAAMLLTNLLSRVYRVILRVVPQLTKALELGVRPHSPAGDSDL